MPNQVNRWKVFKCHTEWHRWKILHDHGFSLNGPRQVQYEACLGRNCGLAVWSLNTFHLSTWCRMIWSSSDIVGIEETLRLSVFLCLCSSRSCERLLLHHLKYSYSLWLYTHRLLFEVVCGVFDWGMNSYLSPPGGWLFHILLASSHTDVQKPPASSHTDVQDHPRHPTLTCKTPPVRDVT